MFALFIFHLQTEIIILQEIGTNSKEQELPETESIIQSSEISIPTCTDLSTIYKSADILFPLKNNKYYAG